MASHSINSSVFYGENRSQLTESTNPLPAVELPLPNYLSDPLLGPSRIWKIFKKQQDALDFISEKNLEDQLLPFAYESINYERLFLVAHPDIFWFRDCQKPAHLRNTYEIISEKRICKLYFDLEFEKSLNKESDGDEMVRTFIRIVLYYIQKIFGVKYKMNCVLILDSSTHEKYSSHLIFQTSILFRNNIHAGNFVKFICNELFKIQNLTTDEDQFNFELFKETTINIYSVQDLFVVNKKNVKVLFCDLGVYTRNRLFRLYKSSKQKKNIPLVLSSINKFKLKDIPIMDSVQYERHIFLMSLITYFITPPEDNENIKEFEKVSVNPNYCDQVNLRKIEKLHTGQVSPTKISPYPELDKFILTRVRPYGSIFRNIHFPTTNVTVYDIKGFRYCGNIGRWHKSQNIKFIADVNRGVYYQKCHDFECSDFKSPEWPIPPEILFKIRNDDEEDLFFQNNFVDLDVDGVNTEEHVNTNMCDVGHSNEHNGEFQRENATVDGVNTEEHVNTNMCDVGHSNEHNGEFQRENATVNGVNTEDHANTNTCDVGHSNEHNGEFQRKNATVDGVNTEDHGNTNTCDVGHSNEDKDAFERENANVNACSDGLMTKNKRNKTQSDQNTKIIENIKENVSTIEQQNRDIEMTDMVDEKPIIIKFGKNKETDENLLRSEIPDVLSDSIKTLKSRNENTDGRTLKEIIEPVVKKIKF